MSTPKSSPPSKANQPIPSLLQSSPPQHTTHYLRSVTIPIILLIVSNLFGGIFLLIPASVQVLLSACTCLYIGCILNVRLKKTAGKVQLADLTKQQEQQPPVSMSEAIKFPIVASIFLFSIYLITTYISKNLLNTVLTLFFSLTTILNISGIIEDKLLLNRIPQSWNKIIFSMRVAPLVQQYLQLPAVISISPASILSSSMGSIPIILYYITEKHWLLNNIFGIFFCIAALKAAKLSSIKVGMLLLWLLFIYDIFWVFGTDVMVSVAKNLDLPIKLLFPYWDVATSQVKKSMLGLGDIVVPGLFVGICLRLDVDLGLGLSEKKRGVQEISNTTVKIAPQNLSSVSLPYFTTCFIFYLIGILITLTSMIYFNHPQPALLFLVPCCTISVALLALVRGEFMMFWQWGDQKKEDKKDQEGQEEKDQDQQGLVQEKQEGKQKKNKKDDKNKKKQ